MSLIVNRIKFKTGDKGHGIQTMTFFFAILIVNFIQSMP